MVLPNVTIGGVKLPPRITIYGVDGIGKSSFAAAAPKPIFIPTEDGCNRLDVAQFPKATTWGQVMENTRILWREKHDYGAAVLDSSDWAQALAIEDIVKTNYEGNMKDFDVYGRGYKLLSQEWRKLLCNLDLLRSKKGMTIILIAHAVVKTFKNPGGDDFDQYKASMVDTPSTSIWGMTKEWSDIVLFANYKVMVRKDSKTATKGKGIMTDGGRRVCYSCPSAAFDAKVRAGWTLPAEFDLNYKVFEKYLNGKNGNGKAAQPEPEAEVEFNETETTETETAKVA